MGVRPITTNIYIQKVTKKEPKIGSFQFADKA